MWTKCLRKFHQSFVVNIKDLFLSFQTTICNLESWLVERFILVETVSVTSSPLIGVLILLSSPVVTIPQLSVAFITRREGVRSWLDDEFRTIFKRCVRFPASEVWFVMYGRTHVACSCGSSEVVNWLVVGSCIHHGSCTVPTTSCMQGGIGFWNLACVESR